MMQKKTWLQMVMVLLLVITACTPPTGSQSETDAAAPETDGVASDGSALQPVTPSSGGDKEVSTNSGEGDESNTDAAESKDEGPILTYERMGGLKGVGPGEQMWQFYEDGRVVGSDGNSWQVEPAAITGLVEEITSSGFETLDSSYMPEDTCCDRVTHIVTLRTATQAGYTVETLDEAEMPDSLAANLQTINNFLMDLYE